MNQHQHCGYLGTSPARSQDLEYQRENAGFMQSSCRAAIGNLRNNTWGSPKKWWYPYKSSTCKGCPIKEPSIWGYPHLWKPPLEFLTNYMFQPRGANDQLDSNNLALTTTCFEQVESGALSPSQHFAHLHHRK